MLLIGRVSTVHQEESNIEAGYRYAERALAEYWTGDVHIKRLGERGSGLLTERATIMEAIEEIETGRWDVVLMEDLSKCYRNPRWQYAFVQDAVDAGCRVICPGDNIDTAEENWEVALGAATLRHGLYIPDTRRRVRRTADRSFANEGMVQKIRFGYRKVSKEDAASGTYGPVGLRIAKLPDCTPIIQEMRRRLLQGDTYVEIAEWLNEEGILPGRYAKSGRWTGRLVEDLLSDPILSGVRTGKKQIFHRIFRTGRFRRERNPSPETKYYSELAHLTPQEHAEVLDEIARRKEDRKSPTPRGSKRRGVGRARAIWPGQAADCFSCEDLMWACNDDQLKCKNARKESETPCWNHVQVPCEPIRENTIDFLLDYGRRHPPFNDVLVDAGRTAYDKYTRLSADVNKLIDREIAELEAQEKRYVLAIGKAGEIDSLLERLKEVRDALEAARRRRNKQEGPQCGLPANPSREYIAANLREFLLVLARTSYDFGALMRKVFPVFIIQPVQALDTGLVRPRARLVFRPGALLPNADEAGADEGDVELVWNLFTPAKHIRDLEVVLTAKRENPKLSLMKLANLLRAKGHDITHAGVKRTLDYAKRMAAEGLTDPYRELRQKPEQASRWKPRRKRQRPNERSGGDGLDNAA